MSDEETPPSEPQTPAEQESLPSKYQWERDTRGHLTDASAQAVSVEITRLYRAGAIRSIGQLGIDLGLAPPTVRRCMAALGLIGGAGNQNKPGGVAVRTNGIETKVQRKKRIAAEAAAKRAAVDALKSEQARVRAERGQAADDTPVEPPVTNHRKVPKARVMIAPGVLPGSKDAPDLLAQFSIPEGFDVLERVRKIAAAPWIDVGKQLQALEILLKQTTTRGKVDWGTITMEQIPEEMRHRLAGMLLPWADFAELPEVVRSALMPCRQVYRLTGVLPVRAEDATVVLERWDAMRLELRELAGEVRAPTSSTSAPLELDLAAEVAYTAPQWETDSGN